MHPTITTNEPLSRHTSWRIGGPARFFAEAASIDELRAALDWAHERDLPLVVLGGGTNLLALDRGFPGLVLRYRAQGMLLSNQDRERAGRAPAQEEAIHWHEALDPLLHDPENPTTRVWVAAGAPMAGTARRLAGQGWAGLEWAEGLPGTIGGAVFGNAGCYGGDIASALTRAWLLDGDAIVEWPVERFAYAYRASALKSAGQDEAMPIVVAAEFRLERADPRDLAERMRRTAAERKSKTPVGSSCGSVFKNPPGQSAGRLIEAAGLKGTRVGGAEISPKHANYIVNLGGASSDDVLALIDLARERVLRDLGIELELEIRVVGEAVKPVKR